MQSLRSAACWAKRCRCVRGRGAWRRTNEDIWAALRARVVCCQRHEEAFEALLLFEPHAKVSARIVAAGLLSARIAAGTDYEDRYLPLALDWPYRAGEAGYVGVVVAQAQYFDVAHESLKRLYDAYNALRQEERTGIADLAARPERKPGPLASVNLAPTSAITYGPTVRTFFPGQDRSRSRGTVLACRAATEDAAAARFAPAASISSGSTSDNSPGAGDRLGSLDVL